MNEIVVTYKMITKCPHCGGRLLEKHEELIKEQGKTIKILNLRCSACGKWTKQEIE